MLTLNNIFVPVLLRLAVCAFTSLAGLLSVRSSLLYCSLAMFYEQINYDDNAAVNATVPGKCPKRKIFLGKCPGMCWESRKNFPHISCGLIQGNDVKFAELTGTWPGRTLV